jgi:hypothetical protein
MGAQAHGLLAAQNGAGGGQQRTVLKCSASTRSAPTAISRSAQLGLAELGAQSEGADLAWPNWRILSLALPRRMSIRWPAPKPMPLISRTR